VRVGIDVTALVSHGTGVDSYVRGLMKHLIRAGTDHRLTFFVNYEDRALLNGEVPDNVRMVAGSLRPRPVRLAFQQLALPAAWRRLELDVVHSPAFLMPVVRGRPRHLLTVYDMTFFSLPQVHTRLHRSAAFRYAVRTSIRRADQLIVPSESTRDDVTRCLPTLSRERVEVIPPGVSQHFRPRADDEVRAVRERFELPRDYVLHVGTIEPRKNLRGLIDAYDRLVAGGATAHLVLAGRPGGDLEALKSVLASRGLSDRVHLLGYVARQDLPALYSAARVFVFPSIYEGFGFPPLEAMACGVPTIAARSSAVAENLGGAAELVAPWDTEALAEAMRRLLRDEDLRRRRRREGMERAASFSWQTTARKTLACYEEVAARSASL